MYPVWLSNLMFFFDCWGHCSQFNTSPRHRKLDSVIFVMQILLVTIFTILILIFLKRPVQDNLGIFNDGVKMTAMIVVYWLSIIESYSKRHAQRRFWTIIKRIDRQFCVHRYRCFKKYIFKMITYAVFMTIFLSNYIFYIPPDSELHYFWLAYTSFSFYYNTRLFYYLFFLEFIKNELQVIDQEVSQILSSFERHKLKSAKEFVKEFHRKRFKWFREYYESIYDLCMIVNSVCGWSNVVAIHLPFLLLLTDMNWFYWKILNMYNIDVIGNLFSISRFNEQIFRIFHVCAIFRFRICA